MIIICNFWLVVGSLLQCVLKIVFDQCARKIALVLFFYFLYCQHLQATILLCALKYQATEFFFLSLPETSFNISTPPFRGCMKNVKNPNTASVIFDETVGVSKKCSDDWKVTNKVP